MSVENAYSIIEAIAEIHACAEKLKLVKFSEAEETAEEILLKHKNMLRISLYRSAKYQLVRHSNFAMVMFLVFSAR